jgi:hypothetical protein
MQSFKNHECVMNLELHHAVQRLITEWRGIDAATQTSRLPELVEQIVKLKELAGVEVSRLASHDAAEAA